MSLRLINTAASSLAKTSSAGRAHALLGDTPTLTLVGDVSAPDACYTARLICRGDVWLGVVDDHAAFTDRVRMGLVPHFLFGDANVVTVSGTARTRILGRLSSVAADVQAAVAPLLGPWVAGDAVVIEVCPEALVVDTDEAHGVVPRT